MGLRTQIVLLLVLWIQALVVSADTNGQDLATLLALKTYWTHSPADWKGADPCGASWAGISCTNTRITSIALANLNIVGELSGDIGSLTELQILDLSYNTELTGPLTPAIGNLKKLTNLVLVGCGFSGSIPDTIGSMTQLVTLSLNSNKFSGKIPASIGQLPNLYWLDLASNQLEGSIPVSDGTSPGLDMLLSTKHFHFGQNKLSGPIPEKLFSSDMILIHVLFDENQFTGNIPTSLALLPHLEVLRLDRNLLSGTVPSNLNNLTSVHEMYLSNNAFSGPLPILNGSNLITLDLSNNSFDESSFPTWIPTLQSLSTLRMQNTKLKGPVPSSVFSLPNLQTVDLKNNLLSGTLNLGTGYSKQLEVVDLQSNVITDFTETEDRVQVILIGNPVCMETGQTHTFCTIQPSSVSYSTPPKNCVPRRCKSGQVPSPNCICAHPTTGILEFRAPSFSSMNNNTIYGILEDSLMKSFSGGKLAVESVSLSNPRRNPDFKILIDLDIFPSGREVFTEDQLSEVTFYLSNQTYKPPPMFGPYIFTSSDKDYFSEGAGGAGSKNAIIIGAAVGGFVLLILLLVAGVYAYRQKKRAEKATGHNNPFAKWDQNNSDIGGAPQLQSTRSFTFDEMKRYSNDFSSANVIGTGGYGQVYKGVMPNGKLLAIKRAQQGSLQGGLEFKTELELLSRVNHRNVVGLLGFCFERGEQMLVYEFIPGGSVKDGLTGKSGIRLDWSQRLKIALGSAKGLAYLHELANPPIIHRDIKSMNILLDERLTPKVADFGLSKLLGEGEQTHITTQVKGTLGYLDPEYYMTNQLTEKSDVYSFGVVLFELINGRNPIERGKYIVREVKLKMDVTKSMYNLDEFLDPNIGAGVGTHLKGFERYVDLALHCVEETGSERPSMGEVVKEIENIMQIAGMNPNADSATASATYLDTEKGSGNPYDSGSFEYSGSFVPGKIEPK